MLLKEKCHRYFNPKSNKTTCLVNGEESLLPITQFQAFIKISYTHVLCIESIVYLVKAFSLFSPSAVPISKN